MSKRCWSICSVLSYLQVEGVLPATPSVVYQFLQLSTKPGGKLDYMFRNENFLQHYSGVSKVKLWKM